MAGVATLEQQHRAVGLLTRSARPGGSPGSAGVVQRVAGIVASSLTVEELFTAVAKATIEGIPAARCNAFVVRDGALSPVDGDLPALPLDAPVALRLLGRDRTIGVADLTRSSLRCLAGPEADAGSLLAAPVVADGTPLGALVVVWDAPGRVVAAHERELLETIAALVGVALQRREAERRAARVSVLAAAAAALGQARTADDVVAALEGACAALWPAATCRVLLESAMPSLFAADEVAASLLGGPADASGVTERFFIGLPVTSEAGTFGAVVVRRGAATPAPSSAELEVARTAASLAADALARVEADEQARLRLHEAEVLARLSHVVACSGGLADAVRELNRTLAVDLGVKLRSISIANAKLRVAVGGRIPDAVELEAVRSWRAVLAKGGSLRCRPVPGGVLVPVAHRTKVHGAMRVAAGGVAIEGATEALLLAMGAACAELVHKAGLREQLADSERRLAVAAERDRIAQDLHDSVGQLIVAMGMRLAQYVADAPDKVWRLRLEELLQMAGRGNREVRQSVYALLFLEARGTGLASSIRELCSRFEITTGLPVRFQQRGTPTAMASVKEDALFRTAHEALVNAERHARASMLTVQLVYGSDGVRVSVRDDGVGLRHRDPFGRSGHFGIRAMQRRVEEAGGELRVTNAEPRGVLVEASVSSRKGAVGVAGARRRRR
ncbi:MAG: GAF domain-containing sensor histidine kinase [Actinobacteria bacterium]|nr:GAF domain-containing sensor histidine kinase [Actinomycetota bacterium]